MTEVSKPGTLYQFFAYFRYSQQLENWPGST